MTTSFRIDSLSIETVAGRVPYSFPDALTVMAGSVGVGKSTLFELIKHTLGCDALLAGVVRSGVFSATVDLTLGRSRYRLTRTVDPQTSTRVRVHDLVDRRDLPDHFTDKNEPSLNSLLLSALGIPDDMRAASKAVTSTKQGARITFADVFKYMYVPQADINKEIAGSEDTWYVPKRKAVFELLFALTSPAILEIQSNIAAARGEHEAAVEEHRVVAQFLSDSKTPSRVEMEIGQENARLRQLSAERELDDLRSALRPAVDRETQTLRDLLNQAERSLSDARNVLAVLDQQRADFRAEHAHVRQDIARLERMVSVGERIAQIEFAICPRCMQRVSDRSVPDMTCRLCLLPEPQMAVANDSGRPTYELTHLREQEQELADQVSALSAERQAVSDSVKERARLIDNLSRSITERTQDRITPQLQAYTDAAAQVADAQAKRTEFEQNMRLWDRADDLAAVAQLRLTELRALETSLDELNAQLSDRRREVLDDLDEEFAVTVRAIGVPGALEAQIDRKNYLPLINGQPLHLLSPAGGIRTTTIVAYWITLLTIALRRHDTLYPGFLLIDSPRTSLNDNDDLSASLYRRLVTMADSAGARVQLIVGDNELPSAYRRDYAQIDFDYDHPTISTLPHPGRGAVETIEP